MKRIIIISSITIIVFLVSIFIYNRYKAKRIEPLIGANQHRVEEYLNYPNEHATLVKINPIHLEDRIRKIINKNKLETTLPILKYTFTGNVRKQQFWLIDRGEGYYVFEAIDSNL